METAFYTLPDIARLMRISPRHCRRLLRDNLIPAPVRFGRCHRWPRAQFEAWMGNGCQALNPKQQFTPAEEHRQAVLAASFYANKAERLEREMKEAK